MLAGGEVYSSWGLRVCTISEMMRLRPSADLQHHTLQIRATAGVIMSPCKCPNS